MVYTHTHILHNTALFVQGISACCSVVLWIIYIVDRNINGHAQLLILVLCTVTIEYKQPNIL